MSPTFTGSSKSAIWCFKCSDVIEIRNEIMFNFHTGLPHVNGVERVVLCEFERLLSFSSTSSPHTYLVVSLSRLNKVCAIFLRVATAFSSPCLTPSLHSSIITHSWDTCKQLSTDKDTPTSPPTPHMYFGLRSVTQTVCELLRNTILHLPRPHQQLGMRRHL